MMRLYVVRVTRLRDRFVQYPAGAVRLEEAEGSAKELVKDFGKKCREDLRQAGSRCWRNSAVEVAIESKKAPFKLKWVREEWTQERL